MPADAAAMDDRAGQAGFDLSAYLARIGLDAPPPATAEGLARLVRAHRLALSFENLDIPLGRGINLDPGAVFDKLVRRRRGGYCFEQNALFEGALAALGFVVRPLLARVWLGMPEAPPPVTHQLELVTIGGREWIADAGFGGSFVPPLALMEGVEVGSPDGARHRLTRREPHGWMLERLGASAATDGRGEGDGWQPQYSFTLDPVHDADREQCNHWTSTRPGTRFTSLVIASRVTADGFLSLTGLVLRESGGRVAREMVFGSAAALQEALDAHFGIGLDRDEAERLFAFSNARPV